MSSFRTFQETGSYIMQATSVNYQKHCG